jgi:hypothetical protein
MFSSTFPCWIMLLILIFFVLFCSSFVVLFWPLSRAVIIRYEWFISRPSQLKSNLNSSSFDQAKCKQIYTLFTCLQLIVLPVWINLDSKLAFDPLIN